MFSGKTEISTNQKLIKATKIGIIVRVIQGKILFHLWTCNVFEKEQDDQNYNDGDNCQGKLILHPRTWNANLNDRIVEQYIFCLIWRLDWIIHGVKKVVHFKTWNQLEIG